MSDGCCTARLRMPDLTARSLMPELARRLRMPELTVRLILCAPDGATEPRWLTEDGVYVTEDNNPILVDP